MAGRERSLLIVEDELLTGSLLQTQLQSVGFQVKLVASVQEASRVLRTFDPDIVLIDIHLKGGPNGLYLGQMLAATRPDIAQVYLTGLDEVQLAGSGHPVAPRGAGFVSKRHIGSVNALLEEIDRVVGGRQTVPPLETPEGLGAMLTPKAQQVLQLLAEGFSNQLIADQLKLSVKTVEYRIEQIYQALGIDRESGRNARVEAAVRYHRDQAVTEWSSDQA